MFSQIRPATDKEIKRAETIRNKSCFSSGIQTIIAEAESMGFKTIYDSNYQRNRARARILMPSRNVLCWDYNPRSLDRLRFDNKEELASASLYAGYVAQSVFAKDIEKIIG